MGIKGSDGFTIIETMLFLGVSGLMIFGILAGTGTAINQQRYRDSVNSLAMRLQQQYDDINGIQNDRTVNWTCTNSTPVESGAGVGESRGASGCIILGKYVVGSGSSLNTSVVIGQDVRKPDTEDDVTAITDTQPAATTLEAVAYPLEWDAKMVQHSRGSNTPASFSMLIVRSPLSGSVRTFVANGVVPVSALASVANLSNGTTVCIDSTGLFTGPRQAISIAPNASSATAISIDGTEANGC